MAEQVCGLLANASSVIEAQQQEIVAQQQRVERLVAGYGQYSYGQDSYGQYGYGQYSYGQYHLWPISFMANVVMADISYGRYHLWPISFMANIIYGKYSYG